VLDHGSQEGDRLPTKRLEPVESDSDPKVAARRAILKAEC